MGVAALALVAVSGGVGAGVALHERGGAGQLAPIAATNTSASTKPGSLSAIAAAVSPSVVSITVRTGSGGDEGSGVIVKSDGTILTNNHVVQAAANGAGAISVTFSDGTKKKATIVGRDASDDLAVIKAQGVSGRKAATFGNSDALKVGDTVLAIGSPLGLDGSVTSGIVSALNRTVTTSDEQQGGQGGPFGQGGAQRSTGSTITGAIQTDAAINPGNSGGPLVNSAGQVIGIDTAIASTGGGSTGGQSGNIGVGFAIPSNEAHDVAQQLLTTGHATHAYLGVRITDPTGNASGALVASVTKGSPAAKAGLKQGDLITAVNGTKVTDADDLVAAVRAHSAGDKVTVHYTRGGSSHTGTATLASHG